MNLNYKYMKFLYRFCFTLIVATLFLFKSANAQDGNIYLHNYSTKIDNHHILAIYQGHDGLVYFVNHKGVVNYDGVRWKNLKIHNTPESESVAPGKPGYIYVGCHQNFGYIKHDNQGNETYVSLSGKTHIPGDITKIEFTKKYAYFFSSKGLYRVVLATNKFDMMWPANPAFPFEGILNQNDNIFINVRGIGLHKVTNKRMELVNGTKGLSYNRIVSSFKFDDRRVAFSTDSNFIYLFDGYLLTKFKLECQQYLDLNLLSCGAMLSKDAMALGTLSGGCVIVDTKTGKTKHTINYQTGLPDDEITALGSDRQGGIWIAHASGITRADYTLPIKKYSSYPGLEGHITSAIHFNDTLYVATSEGLFYLSKVEKIDDIEEYIKDTVYSYSHHRSEPLIVDEPKPVYRRETPEAVKTIIITKTEEAPKSKIGQTINSWLGIKNKNKKAKIDTAVHINKSTQQIAPPVKTNVVKKVVPKKWVKPVKTIAKIVTKKTKSANRIRKEIYALQSIPYIYKRVGGLIGKCRQMIEFNHSLIVATNLGLFEVKGEVASPIIKNVYINFIHRSEKNPNVVFVGTPLGLHKATFNGLAWTTEKIFTHLHPNINTIAEDNNHLWLGAFNQIIRIDYKDDSLSNPQVFTFNNGYSESINVREIDGKVIFIFNSGILEFNEKTKKFVTDKKLAKYHTHNTKFIFNQPGHAWSNSNFKWKSISYTQKDDIQKSAFIDLFDKVQDIYKDNKGNIWVIHDNTLHCIENNAKLSKKHNDFFVEIRYAKDKSDKNLDLDTIQLDYANNYLSVEVAAPYYLNEAGTEYQYQLEGLHHKEWSKWSRDPQFEFPYLPIGNYKLHIRAKNVFGQISNEKIVYIKINPPFWKSYWFIALVVIGVGVILYLIVFLRLKSLEKANLILEEKVKTRTATVMEQKAELEQQKNVIEELYRDVTDSINYAQKIQYAILPEESHIRKSLTNAFVFFRPKNIVSGDFYWFTERADRYIIAAVDCTGHGVPGAFMSMIGNTLLNQIVNEKNIVEPAEVLNELHIGIRKMLKQDNIDNVQRDGMDIVLLSVHKFRKEVQYAGANNSLYYVQNGELKEIKANKFSIGGLQKEENRKFTNHILHINTKTTFYLTSDGYADQFDEAFENKFSTKRFKALLTQISNLPAIEQKSKLEKEIDEWKGTEEQLDDLMVLGFTIESEFEN